MKKIGFIIIFLVMCVMLLMNVSNAVVKYSIIHEALGIRYDGGKNYFVLLNPVNLQNDSFKNDIKQVIKEIVKQKGGEILIDFFDDQSVLEKYYNYRTKLTIKVESKTEERHHIASFVDQLKTDPFFNGLFLPWTFKR